MSNLDISSLDISNLDRGDPDVGDLAKSLEEGSQFVFGYIARKAAD